MIKTEQQWIADPSLAELGREEIILAEKEMPGLMAVREKYGPQQPFKGMRIMGSLHMTTETAVLLQHLFHTRHRRRGRRLSRRQRLCMERRDT